MKILYLMREDLRLYDNPALSYAAKKGSIQPLFVYPEGLGGASYWWLHHSLTKLQQSFLKQGVTLALRTGSTDKIVLEMAHEIGAERVVWNRVYSPDGIRQGEKLKQQLALAGIQCQSFNAQLLIEPTKIRTQQNQPYKVFTPFWRACLRDLNPEVCLEEPVLTAIKQKVKSEQLDDWRLLPVRPNWAGGLAERWVPGEGGAQQQWSCFLNGPINGYKEGRDVPSLEQTSYLSPHLAFGEISPRQLWHEIHAAMILGDVDAVNGNKFISELGWREFSRYLLVHFPHILHEPFNQQFENFPWKSDSALVRAWQQGKTGYPIVDAGMRELWHTGYMHNRVRMIVASFLTKHCLSHWQIGAAWFWDTLVDADLANNTASWQWVAGCGADAAPYFRIFNPLLQSAKFDRHGRYLRHWLPELKELPNKYLHSPWEAPPEVLVKSQVLLGKDYPHPVVDHKEARQLALSSYQAIKSDPNL